jgi:organic hydroperoxide reductase OsmC/OhrA
MGKQHHYKVRVEWSGNKGTGTSAHHAYGRDHEITAGAKPLIPGSSDPSFRGDPARWNPEDLLVASLSACHKLWYLHLCSVSGIVVTSYSDQAEGVMEEDAHGSGRFTRVVLRPTIEVRHSDDVELAERLHHEAHSKCFIANSVNFPIDCEPSFTRRAA